MTFPYLGETKDLNELTRKDLGGAFASLTEGFTHYQLGGNDAGIPVVLVHGFSVPSYIYDPTFEFLVNSGFRVLRYDLFGRGYSDRPLVQYDIHLFVRQLKDLLDALKFERVDLVGLSMGGPVTAAFLQKHPSYVRKHVMIDPSGVSPVSLSSLLEVVKIPVIGELLIGLVGNGSLVKGIASDFFNPELVEMFQERYKLQMQYEGFKQAILSSLRNGMLDTFLDIYVKISALKKPTLLFWGENDTTTPFKDHQTLLKLMPQIEFHPIKNCSHLPHYEKAEIVNPILKEFLTS